MRMPLHGNCNGKPCYSKRDAQTKLNERRRCGVVLRMYQCLDCDYWHLTKKL